MEYISLGVETLIAILGLSNNYYSEYKKYVKDIEAVYRNMVKNEESFSLSYGFERYINEFRDFINDENDIELAISNNEQQFKKIIQNFSDDKVTAVFSQSMTQRMLFIYNARNDGHDEKIEVIKKYVDDEPMGLNVKPKEKRDINAWECFNWFINNKNSLERLEAKRKELNPIIREIKIKYEQD